MNWSNYNQILEIGDIVIRNDIVYKISGFMLHLDAILVKGINQETNEECIVRAFGLMKKLE